MKLSIVKSEEYPHHELDVKDWVAKEKEILNRQKQQIYILKETPARIDNSGNPNPGAYYIKFKTWIPKSVCQVVNRMERALGEF